MDLLLWFVGTAVWLAIGLHIGRRHRRSGTAILWVVVLGPLGLLLFGYGELRRSRIGPDPYVQAGGAGTAAEDLDLAVTVRPDTAWMPGTLQAWAVDESGWRGWVEYEVGGACEAGWFPPEQIRRNQSEGPDPSA